MTMNPVGRAIPFIAITLLISALGGSCLDELSHPENPVVNYSTEAEWKEIRKLWDGNDCLDDSSGKIRQLYYKVAERALIQYMTNALTTGEMTNSVSPEVGTTKWNSIRESVEYIWSPETSQRFAGQTSLSGIIAGINSYDELKRRIQDGRDSLDDLSQYRSILSVPGFPGKLYWMVEKLFWKGEYERAKNGLEFLLSSENRDDFVRGASKFFLARMLVECCSPEEKKGNEAEALPVLLSIHDNSTCLTYIAISYIMSARIYMNMGYPLQARSLLMVEVPSMDYRDLALQRNFEAAKCCLKTGDVTNYVTHMKMAYGYADNMSREYIARRIDMNSQLQEIWNGIETAGYSEAEITEAAVDALSEESGYPCFDEYCAALAHQWPKLDELPVQNATNRVLNNNYLIK